MCWVPIEHVPGFYCKPWRVFRRTSRPTALALHLPDVVDITFPILVPHVHRGVEEFVSMMPAEWAELYLHAFHTMNYTSLEGKRKAVGHSHGYLVITAKAIVYQLNTLASRSNAPTFVHIGVCFTFLNAESALNAFHQSR